MIGGGLDVVDVIDCGHDLDEVVDEFGSSVSGEFLGDAMSGDDIFIDEGGNGLSISFFKCSSFNPFGEVVNCDNNIAFSSECSGEWAHDVDSYLVEGFGSFLDGFQGGFSSFSFSFLASGTSTDVLLDVGFHFGPVVEI